MRRQLSEAWVHALRRSVPQLATLVVDDLRHGLALRSGWPREGWSRARPLLHWDRRAGKVRTTTPLGWNCCLCGCGSGTQVLAFLCTIIAELKSLCFLFSAARSASADSFLMA